MTGFFRRRNDGLEDRLRGLGSEPRSDLVSELSGEIRASRIPARMRTRRFAAALVTTAIMLIPFVVNLLLRTRVLVFGLVLEATVCLACCAKETTQAQPHPPTDLRRCELHCDTLALGMGSPRRVPTDRRGLQTAARRRR